MRGFIERKCATIIAIGGIKIRELRNIVPEVE